jgi:hypothetical protein
MSKIPWGLSLVWQEPVAGDRRIIDRKLGKSWIPGGAFARPCQPFQLFVWKYWFDGLSPGSCGWASL